MGQETTSYNAKEFIDNWKWVWSRFACLPNFQEDMKGRLFIDILNEPDSQGQGWQPKDGKAGAWGFEGFARARGGGAVSYPATRRPAGVGGGTGRCWQGERPGSA
jgi:hypothetical protein